MPDKRVHASAKRSGLRLRIETVLDNVFDGHQSRMANELGVSQSLISLVLSGQLPPGRRLIAALKKHPKINADWLVTGQGVAIQGKNRDVFGDIYLPVFDEPLPGSPAAYKARFSGLSLPVSMSDYSPARYMLRVTQNCALVSHGETEFKVGDLLLMDTVVDGQQLDLHSLDGKVCVIRSHSGNKSDIELARVSIEKSGQTLLCYPFKLDSNTERSTPQPPITATNQGRGNRMFMLGGDAGPPVASEHQEVDALSVNKKTTFKCLLEAVVAVAISLRRTL